MSTQAELLKLAEKWKADSNGATYICGCELESFANRLDAVAVSDASLGRMEDAYRAELSKTSMYADRLAPMRAAVAALESVLPDERDVDLVPDAKRYRWLRSKAAANQYEHPIVVSQSLADGKMYYMGPMLGHPLDTAIDRAIASAKGDDNHG